MTAGVDLLEEVHRVLSEAGPRAELVPCEIRSVSIGRGRLTTMADEVARLAPAEHPRVVLLMDPTPVRVNETLVKPWVQTRLEKRFAVQTVVLDDGHSELHVTDPVIAEAADAVKDADVVVSVGGGTITDIAKLASEQGGGVPLVVVQTAASVDGYTDNVSVVLRHGVKRTIPSCWPEVVIADTELIAQAPAAMNRAGFGEINSMFTAPADWYLASLLGFDATFHRGPIALLEEVGRGIEEWSPGLAYADPDSTERLVRALNMRGIATGVSGTTACLSGVEHLVSHMLDIYRAAQSEPAGLHGAQVGVGSVVAAVAWEMLFERLDACGASELGLGRTVPNSAALEETVKQQFGPLDTSGALAAECWRDYATKVRTWLANRDRVDALLAGWSERGPELRELVRPSKHIATGLLSAGAPARFADLDSSVSTDLARWSVQYCALMRNRFTVIDLLTFFGWWTDEDVTAVLDRADAAGRAGKAGS